MTVATWGPRPVQAAAERTANLYRNIIGALISVQAGFLATFAAVYAYAAILMTGEPLNDLGVALGREMVLSDLAGVWLLTSAVSVVVAVALAAGLPRRWARR